MIPNQIRVTQLEESAEFDQALIAKLQIDAAQVVGKDKLIAELQSEINDYVELVRALEAGQKSLLDQLKVYWSAEDEKS